MADQCSKKPPRPQRLQSGQQWRSPLHLDESEQLRSKGPDYWRTRAEEVRALADKMEDPEIKRDMLDIAAGYDRMARQAETRATLETALKEPNR
jgi:hypothetical protein